MKGRVLLADDALFMREMIREIIEPDGFEVIGEATDGIEAIEQFRRLQPDIVTMDIVMPRLSGIDAVERIIQLDPSAKIIMCSALGQEALVMEALKAGAKDFVVKPFKPEDVLGTLQKVLEKDGENE